jgi:hypothetical protein
MKKALLLFIFIPQLSFSTNWLVGPSRTYTKPSQVSTLVAAGDTISIDSATYTADVCRWTAANLLIRGVGGRPVLDANNTAYGRKGIFVIDGNNCIVDNIEFKRCHDVPGLDLNWAGIRFEGSGIIIRRCYFHDNDDGILENGLSTAPIVIEFTEFNHNGYGDGYSHNLYINHSDTLIFRYNYSHQAHVGHELKSRAHVNYILYNRISNEATGDASREIDLPNGGYVIAMGNVIEQGPLTQNSGIIGYGLEGLSNPAPHNFYFINNTVVNDRSGGTFIALQTGMDLYKAYNNIFAGSGTLLSGSAVTIDTLDNLRATIISSCAFLNAANYDYHLTSASTLAINNGTNAGTASSGFSLIPLREYIHPADTASRINNAQIDIGAYEFNNANGLIKTENNYGFHFSVVNKALRVFCTDFAGEIWIMDISGKTICKRNITSPESSFDISQLSAGMYLLEFISFGRRVAGKFIIE